VEVERGMDWKQLLAYITGSVDQELLLRNEYLITETASAPAIPGRVRLGNEEQEAAEIGRSWGSERWRRCIDRQTRHYSGLNRADGPEV
jgi:hypothetical protein